MLAASECQGKRSFPPVVSDKLLTLESNACRTPLVGTTFFPGTLKPPTFPKCFPFRDMRNRWFANAKGLRAYPNWKPRCTTSGKEGPCPVQRNNLFKLCQRSRRSHF